MGLMAICLRPLSSMNSGFRLMRLGAHISTLRIVAFSKSVLRERVAVAERQQAYRRVKARFVGLVRDFTADQPKGLVPVLGAPEFIRELRCKAGVVVAFATGGWRETAAMKLQSVGIEFESSPFATSSDAASRTEIMRLAERQAAACGSSARQTYFGDAPWDKKASADLGYDFVAVGGRVEHSQRFEDFSDQKAVLDVLGVYQVDASDLGR